MTAAPLPMPEARQVDLANALRAAPGIERYASLFPRLDARHLRFLGNPAVTPAAEAAELFTAAGGQEPPELGAALQEYRDRGELPALRAVADPETVTRAAADWQRKIDEQMRRAEAVAALCDAEGVPYTAETWASRVGHTREQVGSDYADNPAAQDALLRQCLADMDSALEQTRQALLRRLADAAAELAAREATLNERDAAQGREYAESAGKCIAGNNLYVALRRVGQLEDVLKGKVVRTGEQGGERLPLARRRNPLGRAPFHFGLLTEVARRGLPEVERRGLTEYLPDAAAVEQACDARGFVAQHAARGKPNWSPYWVALRDWLGLDDPRVRRDEQQRRVRRRLSRLDMPNLEPRGENLPGRWVFVPAEPWQGAPWYEDVNGRPRYLALVRLAVPDADWVRPQRVIPQYVVPTLNSLLVQLPAETEDERRFRQDGLVIVLLPGETLSGRKIDQLRQQIPLEKSARANRVAYLDDLDVLRLLRVPADDRFRALLELALPRFPDALSQTYQNSDAVRPRMFFGRSDELSQLERDKGVTVIFSGRKMGKSSLLSRLQGQCTADSGDRAILVGCSGIASGRSWTVLREVERELHRLLPPADEAGAAVPAPPAPAAMDGPAQALEAAKERFRTIIDATMRRLEAANGRRLYVLLDEADNFVRAELEETSGGREPRSAVSWFLRDLETSAYPGRLRFIFAGYDQIGRIFRDPGLGHSAFANWGELLKLKPLDPAAAGDLVVRPLTALGMLVGVDVRDRILDYTSGHASLIQAFCRKLAERVRDNQADWPLNDVPVAFEDVQAIAADQRGGGQTYRELLEQTLSLNLEIARAYPLKLLFLALVAPTGFGFGRVLGWRRFTFEEVLEQVQVPDGEPPLDLPATLVIDSLDLLAQLGLLEDDSDSTGRGFTFKARHFVNVLRTKNGFQAQLEHARLEWQQSGRRGAPAEPRYVWTLPDSDLRALRQKTPRPAVAVGLPSSGRDYLTEMLREPYSQGPAPTCLRAELPNFANHLEALLAAPAERPLVVADPGDQIPWPQLAAWLRLAAGRGIALRWVGGAQFAWALAGDLDVALLLDGVYGLGPLTAAELEPWAARQLGADPVPSAVSIPDPEREPLLRCTGGLLPVLEGLRSWLKTSDGSLPDPLRVKDAERYLDDLTQNPFRAERAAGKLAFEIPCELRDGLHRLFTGAHDYEDEDYALADLGTVSTLTTETLQRVLDAAEWLGFVQVDGSARRVQVLHRSIHGLLIRQSRFAAP